MRYKTPIKLHKLLSTGIKTPSEKDPLNSAALRDIASSKDDFQELDQMLGIVPAYSYGLHPRKLGSIGGHSILSYRNDAVVG